MSQQISSNTTVLLTALGKKRVESMVKGPSTLGFAIMTHLYDSGGMTIGELMAVLGFSKRNNKIQALAALKVLKKEGMIQIAGGMVNGEEK